MRHEFGPTNFHVTIGVYEPVRCVRDDFGNIYHPAYTVVAKAEKARLPS